MSASATESRAEAAAYVRRNPVYGPIVAGAEGGEEEGDDFEITFEESADDFFSLRDEDALHTLDHHLGAKRNVAGIGRDHLVRQRFAVALEIEFDPVKDRINRIKARRITSLCG